MTMHDQLIPMILPTVMIPLTMLSVGVSVVASFIAALFGIQLKLEGPKKLLEVLLKPKVLASAFVLNALIFGGTYVWRWWKNYPRLISTIVSQSNERARPSELNYNDVPAVPTKFSSAGARKGTPEVLDQIWRIHTGKGSFRAALISNDRIFSGNDNGIVSEIELTTGKVMRTFYVGTAASAELTIWKNSLYVGEGVHDTHRARVYRFDLKSGKFMGSYQTKGHTEGQAVVGTHEGESSLLIVAGIDGLHAVDPVTMQGKWHMNIGHMDAGVVVDNGTIFIGTGREKDDDKKNKTYAAALDFKTGKILWQKELAASSWMRPVLAGENVCYISGEIYFPSQRGHISCFDRKSGEHTIALNTPDPLASTPKVLDGTILYTSIHGLVCRFDLESKRNLWCFDAKGKDASLTGASYDPRGHVVIYPSKADGLYVLDAEDGRLLMHWKPDKKQGEWQKTYADAAVAGEHWILSDDDGSIRALKARFVPKMADSK